MGYDPDRDYQTGQARATSSEQFGIEERRELPAVVSAVDARTLTEDFIAKRWAKRDKLVLRLPPRLLGLEPGAVIDLPLAPTRWVVEQLTVDSMVLIAELRPVWQSAASLPADAGRAQVAGDTVLGPVTLALTTLAGVNADDGTDQPRLYLAASTAGSPSRRIPIEISAAGWAVSTRTAAKQAIIGASIDALGPGQPYLLDLVESFDVQLLNDKQFLTSCDDDALVNGVNLAMLGDELIQFGDAEVIAAGHFRLTRLVRGRAGTEWAMATHAPGDLFLLIERDALLPIAVPAWAMGSAIKVTQQAASGGSTATTSAIASGDNLRPPAPVDLKAAMDGFGNLVLSWIRRSRMFVWLDDVDTPLGESREIYEVNIESTSGATEYSTNSVGLTIASGELGALGAGLATISVRQIGDWAASRPVTTVLSLP